MPVLIGTSGWQYRDWRGGLYPAGVAQRRWLEHYATQYLTVENNSSFYRLPASGTFAGWRARTPDDFVMAVKASRYLTHVRKLRDPAEPVARFLGAAAYLGPKLGPILLQLPPTLTAEPALLDACLAEFRAARLPEGIGRLRIAVEPRHASWWTGEVRQILAAHDAALCWADRLGRPVTPLWRTAGWGYLRFHEGAADPWPSYGMQALRSWADRVQQAWPDDADVYVYFNNDPGGAAVVNSAVFAALARGAGMTVTRTPAVGSVPFTTAMPATTTAAARRSRQKGTTMDRKVPTMNKTTITAEPGMPQITITREFDAPRELVFRAHTDPELLVQWLGPRDLTLTIDRYEARDGDRLPRRCGRSPCKQVPGSRSRPRHAPVSR